MLALFSFIVFIIIFLFFLHKWVATHPRRRNVPPSPRKLPLIGNFHQLIGKSPHRALRALSNIYGPLILLQLGRVPVLVASSAQAAEEITKIQDAVFSSRPKSSVAHRLTYGSRDVAFAPHGPYWRRARSIIVSRLLSNKRVSAYGPARQEETSAMVERVRLMSSSGVVVDLSEMMMSLSSDVVCRVALGRKHGGVEKLVRDYVDLFGVKSLTDYVPWLGRIVDRVNGLDAKIESVVRPLDQFLEKVIQQHRDNINRDGGDDHGEEDDFVHILLRVQKEINEEEGAIPIQDVTIKALVLDMFLAGTETTGLTVVWAIAELMKSPRTMRILEKEVRRAGGISKREIVEEDIEKMPYLKAVIKETLRLHAPVPLLIPRESTQDTRVMGYEISAGTQVLINAWAIGRDPSLWAHPEEFRPERFLDSSVDFKGMHFELIPFGAGRRGCPGIAFAVAVGELALAKLVRNFDFELPDGERVEDLDMSETSGMAVYKRLPLLVTVTCVTC